MGFITIIHHHLGPKIFETHFFLLHRGESQILGFLVGISGVSDQRQIGNFKHRFFGRFCCRWVRG